MAGAAFARVLADLAVQHAQCVKHVVVQVFTKHKRRDDRAQLQGKSAAHAGLRRQHPAFEPGKALPLAALGLEIFFQSAQRHCGRAGIAIGPQRQVHPKHKTVFGGVAQYRVQRAHQLAVVLLVGNTTPPFAIAAGVAIGFVHINQINVAGNIELARTQLAHPDDAQRTGAAIGFARRAMHQLHIGAGLGISFT